MKRIITLFLTILLTRITCFSLNTLETTNQDSIVVITFDQLKYTNLIFVEHKKLLEENKLFNEQIKLYQLKTNSLLKVDSLRLSQIENYKNINNIYIKQIEDLNKDVKKRKNVLTCWKIGSITITTGLVLFLLLK